MGLNLEGRKIDSYNNTSRTWTTARHVFKHNGGDINFELIADGSNNHGFVDNVALVATKVPEPSSTALLGLGALGLFIRRKR